MSDCCTIAHPCACMSNGYLKPECGPLEYRWAIDKLVEEFGADRVRVGWLHDYGRTQKIAISGDGWKNHIMVQSLRTEEGYDLNKSRGDLDAFIQAGRRELCRGFV